MTAWGIWDLGAPGLLYWLRTVLPACSAMAAWSKKPRAAGVAMTWTVQPRSWACLTSVPMAAAGPAPQAMTDRTRGCASWITGESDLAGELPGVAPDARRGRGEQVADEPVDGGASGDFLGRDAVCGTQGDVGLLVPPSLQERAGGVDQQAGFALGHGDDAQVDAAGHVDGGARVAEGDGNADPVLPGIDRAEGGPAKVAVSS